MKLRGTYCEESFGSKANFDPKSFRWKKSGRARILIGCPVGEWNARAKRCRVGTRGYKLLRPAGARCPVGTKRITKR